MRPGTGPGHPAGLQAERDPQGRCLRLGQAARAGQQGAEQLVDRGVGQVRLGHCSGGLQHAQVRGLLTRVPQQGGLADSRLTTEQQAAAVAGARAGEQPVDRGRLCGP